MYKFNTNDFLVRIPLFIIFFWFGLLKVINMSPATELVTETVFWMPFFQATTWAIIIGYWEMAIGLCFFKQKNNFNCYGIVDFTNVRNFSPFSYFARNNFSKFKPLTSYFGRSVYNKKYNYNNCGINNRKKIFDFEQEKYLSLLTYTNVIMEKGKRTYN